MNAPSDLTDAARPARDSAAATSKRVVAASLGALLLGACTPAGPSSPHATGSAPAPTVTATTTVSSPSPGDDRTMFDQVPSWRPERQPDAPDAATAEARANELFDAVAALTGPRDWVELQPALPLRSHNGVCYLETKRADRNPEMAPVTDLTLEQLNGLAAQHGLQAPEKLLFDVGGNLYWLGVGPAGSRFDVVQKSGATLTYRAVLADGSC